jgi:hypothetical protein
MRVLLHVAVECRCKGLDVVRLGCGGGGGGRK